MTVIDLVDSETACTGDEEAAGDTTCGTGAGELSSALSASTARADCRTGDFSLAPPAVKLSNAPTTNFPLGSLQPGETACIIATVEYRFDVPEITQRVAQSDQVQWRFAFDGTTA
jgi:hypothetical protein